jgi:polyisoprenoid-binding protein YceI
MSKENLLILAVVLWLMTIHLTMEKLISVPPLQVSPRAMQCPTLTFASKSVVPTADDEFKVVGDLTMRGVTKEITLMAHFHGISKDMHSERVAGFDLSGSINRTDFGLLWNAAVETGGVTVSDEVKLEMEIEAKEMKQ